MNPNLLESAWMLGGRELGREGSIDLISCATSVVCSEVKGMNGVLFLWK